VIPSDYHAGAIDEVELSLPGAVGLDEVAHEDRILDLKDPIPRGTFRGCRRDDIHCLSGRFGGDARPDQISGDDHYSQTPHPHDAFSKEILGEIEMDCAARAALPLGGGEATPAEARMRRHAVASDE
jgi:hypothetical protein